MTIWLPISLFAAFTLLVSLFSFEVSGKAVRNSTRQRLSHHDENITKGPPVLKEGSEGRIIGVARDNVDLYCPIECVPRCMYEWFKSENAVIKDWERFHFFGKTHAHLQIRSLKHEDSGIYTCKAVNGFGLQHAKIHLVVGGDDPFRKNMLKSLTSKRSSFNGSLPEIVIDQLPNATFVKLNKGANLVLTCEATGNPAPNITWYKNQQYLHGSRGNISALELTNVTEKDSGMYRCEGQNDFGKSIYEIQVQLAAESWQRGAEILGLSPTNLTLVPGESGVITCVVRSETEPPWLVWVKKLTEPSESTRVVVHNGSRFEPLNKTDVEETSKYIYSTRLILNNVTRADSGSYHCLMFSRSVGLSHIEALVYVQADPAQAQSIRLSRQKAATVQWILLWSFAFIIVAILVVVCFSRLYGCRWKPKKFSFSAELKKSAPPTNVEAPAKSPGETVSTMLQSRQTCCSHHHQAEWDMELSFSNNFSSHQYKSKRRIHPNYPSPCTYYCPVPVYQEPCCTPANSVI